MKKKLFLLLFPILFLTSCEKETSTGTAVTPQPNLSLFNGQIGTSNNSTIITNDNQLMICGNFGSDITLIKATKEGSQIWQKYYSSEHSNSVSSITQTVSGDVFLCGNTNRNFLDSKQDILVIKTNFNGDTIWTKTYGGLESDYGINIMTTSDKNLLITSKVEGLEPGITGEIFISKINLNGDILWTKLFEKQGDQNPVSLIETFDKGYLITGVDYENGNRGVYLMKLNSLGQLLWKHNFEARVTCSSGNATIELSNGDLVTVARSTIWDGAYGYAYCTVMKTSSTGQPIWQKEFGEKAESESGYSIRQTETGNFIVTGSSYDQKMLGEVITIFSIDQNGNQIWHKIFRGSEIECSGNSWGANLIKHSSGDNIITGDFEGNIFLFSIDNQGVYK